MRRPVDMAAVRAVVKGETPELRFAAHAIDPVGFARDVLGVQPWSHQRRALDAIAAHRRVSWRSCHGAGKSDTAAIAALWFISTQPNALVILTAPSSRQVRAVLWRAVRRVYRASAQPIGGEIHELPEHGLVYPDGRALVGFSAGDAERFAGLHAPNVLLIVDEASGIEQEIIEAAKGALTGAGRMLMISNPTRTSGEFFDSFNSKAKLWHCLHTSAFDVPNVTGAEPTIPGLVDQQWIDEMAEDYGPESAVYSVRVLGQFPTQVADAVISLDLVDAAKERYLGFTANRETSFAALGPLELGVDVARFGDDSSCIVARRGNVALAPVLFRGADVVQVADRVMHLITDLALADERPIVRVDTVGVGGGVADILRRNAGLEVIDVNAGAAATTDKYQRVRDEMWFGARDWLRSGGAIPSDQKLEAELLAPSYSYSPNGKIVVEPKDETRKRLRRSPDRADALALAVYGSRTVEAAVFISTERLFRRDGEAYAYEAVSRYGYSRG